VHQVGNQYIVERQLLQEGTSRDKWELIQYD